MSDDDRPWSRTLRAIEGGRERIPTIPPGRATAPTVPIRHDRAQEIHRAAVAFYGEGADVHVFARTDGRYEVSATLDEIGATALIAAVAVAQVELGDNEARVAEYLAASQPAWQLVDEIAEAVRMHRGDTLTALRALWKAGLVSEVGGAWRLQPKETER